MLFCFNSSSAVAQSSGLAPWVNDERTNAVFSMYWRAKISGFDAASRLCAIKDIANYDRPQSPYRPFDQRVEAAADRIEKIWPKALSRPPPPYIMPPPQLNCDDVKSAWQSIVAFETAVTELERFLDSTEASDPSSRGNK
jgi:hypothetical protein